MVDGVTRIDLPANPRETATGCAVRLPCFVAGPENRLVAIALERLLSGSDLRGGSQLLNPLVLTGPSGSGKTHLVQGLIRRWYPLLGQGKVAYFTATDFARQLRAARNQGELTEFREMLEQLQLMVVDNLHRLPTSSYVQRELRDTIDTLIELDAVVVVTSQQSALSSAQLEAGLSDRLAAGLHLCLQPPSEAARREILQQAIQAGGFDLDSSRLDRLARRVEGTVPELMRALAESEAEQTLGWEETSKDRLPVTLKQIIAVVARYYSLTQAAICSAGRRKSLVHARAVVVHLARNLTDLSYSQIGHGLGRRDHTTIIHSQRAIKEQMSVDAETREVIDQLQRILSTR